MTEAQRIFESGSFFTGCNYWASHAGTNMWHDWNEAAVESDLARLAEAKVSVLRMFPLWSDFQPLRMHYSGGGQERELRMGEEPMPFTEAGRAGVDIVMADRFERFCDLAEQYGIRLIVGLVTGWMSGRMHCPEAFAGRGLLSDPMVLRWQIKYVRYMVRRFKTHPAIAAWDLGNECNCMGAVAGRDGAYLWVSAITNAIKVEDKSHPVVSGMHSLRPEGIWTPQDQGEMLDILCTHPYPIFTPHCDTDPITEMKTVLHSTAETILYRDLGHVPAFIEEAGTLGPMIADEETAAAFVRACMFSAWAHDLRGYVWWCANEQSALTHTPYDWDTVERELGLFRIDGSKKPVLNEMTRFAEFADSFPYRMTPPLTDAVCILSEGQDSWAAAYGSYVLAKQAGMEITFAWQNDDIPEADCYLVPALTGNNGLRRHTWHELLERVKKGARLYLSHDNALMSPFSEFTGVKVVHRAARTAPDTVSFGGTDFTMTNKYKYVLESVGAKVLAADSKGQPAFTEYACGEGTVYFMAYPIEMYAACEPGVVSGEAAIPYWRFYQALGFRSLGKRAVSDSPYIALTEHDADGKHIVTALNYTPVERTAHVRLKGSVAETFGGSVQTAEDGVSLTLPGNTGMVLVLD